MIRLSVNLNKIALLRNARTTGVPDIAAFARAAHAAGAGGITIHPRPDERHIRAADVAVLAAAIAPWRPGFEYNIEGRPDPRFLDIVEAARPEQVTLVPDGPGALTSDRGWDLGIAEVEVLRPLIHRLRATGARVILFVDPDPTVPERVRDTEADGIEIYTGTYAAAFRRGGHYGPELEKCLKTAENAQKHGLVVNAGHDLNLRNLPPLVRAIPFLFETSIGHELTADALIMGFGPAIQAYRDALDGKGNESAQEMGNIPVSYK